MAERYDVVIVGGGPAGQAAALRTVEAGLSTCIVDEQSLLGGQILRQPPAGFGREGWMAGGLYRDLREQLARAEAEHRLRFKGAAPVLGLFRDDDGWTVTLADQHAGELRAARVLVAAGCYDMPVPLPGWTLPGVMSAGGVQTLLKSQGVLPGQRFVLFGCHPLQMVLADQLVAAGAEVAAVAFPQSFGEIVRRAVPHVLAAAETPGPLFAAMQSWRALRKAGVPILHSALAQRALGDGSRVTGIEFAHRGECRAISCDVAAMCYGFLPQSDLPRAAGVAVAWSDPAGGWETRHDPWMRSSASGLYVAGETTGVTGAEAAMVEGAIAGLAMVLDAGAVDARVAASEHRDLAARRKQLDGFIALLRNVADPRPWLPQPEPETIVCRCEDIDAATIDEVIARALRWDPAFGASTVKLRCRAGMGRCQGRSCEHAIVRRVAAAQAREAADVVGFRTRFPARPVAIADLIDG